MTMSGYQQTQRPASRHGSERHGDDAQSFPGKSSGQALADRQLLQFRGAMDDSQLSGRSLDDVRVHYNSPNPASVQALAYAQGTDIHIAPGEEKHLPHEAWHVVQQIQGRVRPTLQMKGVPINDDPGPYRLLKKSGITIEIKGDTFFPIEQ